MKGKEKKQADVKQEAAKASQVKPEVMDLLDDDECSIVVVQPVAPQPVAAKPAPVKAEVKVELTEAQEKRRKERALKRAERAKKELAEGKPAKPSAKEKKHKEDKEDKDKKRQRGRSRSRKRRSQERSGSSSSGGSDSSSTSDFYKKYKPFTKVRLVNLVRKADLNGQAATVVHPSCAVSPCPPGCILVRLESGREIAVKPPNLRKMDAFHAAPAAYQEDRLQTVLKQIKHNVATMSDPSRSDGGGGSLCILDCDGPQGGVGHLL